jgi:hypothetical protein
MANRWLVVGHSEHYDTEEELNESAPGSGHIPPLECGASQGTLGNPWCGDPCEPWREMTSREYLILKGRKILRFRWITAASVPHHPCTSAGDLQDNSLDSKR